MLVRIRCFTEIGCDDAIFSASIIFYMPDSIFYASPSDIKAVVIIKRLTGNGG